MVNIPMLFFFYCLHVVIIVQVMAGLELETGGEKRIERIYDFFTMNL